MSVAHWLMKSEPESYSWADLVRDGGTEWDGVRNNATRLHLKAMNTLISNSEDEAGDGAKLVAHLGAVVKQQVQRRRKAA